MTKPLDSTCGQYHTQKARGSRTGDTVRQAPGMLDVLIGEDHVKKTTEANALPPGWSLEVGKTHFLIAGVRKFVQYHCSAW